MPCIGSRGTRGSDDRFRSTGHIYAGYYTYSLTQAFVSSFHENENCSIVQRLIALLVLEETKTKKFKRRIRGQIRLFVYGFFFFFDNGSYMDLGTPSMRVKDQRRVGKL